MTQSTALVPNTWFVDAANCPGPGTGTPSDPFCAISTAISAAVNGDTVLVLPGTYSIIGFQGKSITLRSDVDGVADTVDPDPAVTFIDGQGIGPIVDFTPGTTPSAVVEGFTLQNGSTGTDGGGIRCIFSSPTIRGNVIRNCFATSEGGGIYVASGSPLIDGNVIEDNATGGHGGGVFSQFGGAVLTDNVIRDNSALRGGGVYFLANTGTIAGNTLSDNSASDGGGGLWLEGVSTTIRDNIIARNVETHYGGAGLFLNFGSFSTIVNNLFVGNKTMGTFGYGGACLVNSGGTNAPRFVNNNFVGNQANLGGAFLLSSSSKVESFNNIFWGNTAASGSNGHLQGPCTFTMDYSVVQSGPGSFVLTGSPLGTLNYGSGNFDGDPLFVDTVGPDGNASTWEDNDYHLLFASPCVDAGDNGPAPGLDFEGDPRPIDGDQDGIATADIGMDELFCQIFVVGPATPGATITVVIVGPPGSNAYLYVSGSAVAQLVTTPWGGLGIEFPITQVEALGAIPASGMVSTTLTVPSNSIPGEVAFALQGMVGTKFTNALEVVVE